MRRVFISQVDDNGEEWKAGNAKGYATPAEGFKAAEKLAQTNRKTYCVATYDVYPDGDRDCVDVLGYETPEGA